MNGAEVTLADMLRCREKRAAMQRAALERYHSTLISFCMNIPGPVKTNDEIYRLYTDGVLQINSTLQREKIRVFARQGTLAPTGDEMLLCVDADAGRCKSLMQHIEDTHPLGRLFDIDVIDQTGQKISRSQYRTCLLCGEQAQICARMRRHSVPQMQERINQMLQEWISSVKETEIAFHKSLTESP